MKQREKKHKYKCYIFYRGKDWHSYGKHGNVTLVFKHGINLNNIPIDLNRLKEFLNDRL